MLLDLLQGDIFLFSYLAPFFFLVYVAARTGQLKGMTSINYFLFEPIGNLKGRHPSLPFNPTPIVLTGTPICVSELRSNRVSEARKFCFSSHVSLSD